MNNLAGPAVFCNDVIENIADFLQIFFPAFQQYFSRLSVLQDRS